MPQGPLSANVAINPAKVMLPMNLDAQGALRIANGGISNAYNIAAAAVVKATPGRLVRISVITAGSTVGTANDCAATGSAAIGNQIAAIGNTVGVVTVEWPCTTGIVIVPGTGQVVAVSYS